jgi:hypothetical protein
MDPLLIGLVIVDEMNDRRQLRQLADGWMGWEWRHGGLLRARGARLLLAMAARLAPLDASAQRPESMTLEARTQ